MMKAIALVALVSAVACSDGDRGGFGPPPPPPEASTPRSTPSPQQAVTPPVIVRAVGLRFDTERLELRSGETWEITFQNQDDQEHTFVVNELNVAMLAAPGQTVRAEVRIHPGNTGRFPFYCSIPGHRQAGMEGSVWVHR